MGERQKGRNDLKLASLRRDREWVAIARDVAVDLVDADPALDRPLAAGRGGRPLPRGGRRRVPAEGLRSAAYARPGLVVEVGDHDVEALEAVGAAVGDDVAGLPPVLGRVGQRPQRAPALDADDVPIGFHDRQGRPARYGRPPCAWCPERRGAGAWWRPRGRATRPDHSTGSARRSSTPSRASARWRGPGSSTSSPGPARWASRRCRGARPTPPSWTPTGRPSTRVRANLDATGLGGRAGVVAGPAEAPPAAARAARRRWRRRSTSCCSTRPTPPTTRRGRACSAAGGAGAPDGDRRRRIGPRRGPSRRAGMR